MPEPCISKWIRKADLNLPGQYKHFNPNLFGQQKPPLPYIQEVVTIVSYYINMMDEPSSYQPHIVIGCFIAYIV